MGKGRLRGCGRPESVHREWHARNMRIPWHQLVRRRPTCMRATEGARTLRALRWATARMDAPWAAAHTKRHAIPHTRPARMHSVEQCVA
eukprot:3314332-Pleurochrysis_carterae.AAC.1